LRSRQRNTSSLARSRGCPLLRGDRLSKRFELNSTQSLSAENNRQPQQDDRDRHERRARNVSDQDEDDRDNGEDCCDAVVHSFPIVGLADATA
jgi:hypothetical protein